MEELLEQTRERERERLLGYEMALNTAAAEFARPLELIEWNRHFLQDHLERHGREYSPQMVQDSLRDIHSAVEGMNRLVDHFTQLCMCVCGSVPVQKVGLDLASVLRSLCADHEAIHRAIGVRLTLQYEPGDLWYTVADPVLAERVLLHLLGYSLRACSSGEQVVFALDRRRGELLLTVQNNGRSVTRQQAASAFVPSGPDVQPNRPIGQLGTGLLLCGEYCRMLGWKIDLTPQQKGSRITIVIPERWDLPTNIRLHSPAAGPQAVSRVALLQELRSIPGLENLPLESE
ncbi:MAG: ATP-binding protein [Oscillospiraceae bacterium]|nr:ATP-binding protein [Oscillospiraceae bacterium]